MNESFSEILKKINLNEKLTEICTEKLCLKEIKTKQPITLATSKDTNDILEATVTIPFDLQFSMKNYGIETVSYFSFDVQFKNLSSDGVNDDNKYYLDKNYMEFSFKTNPIYNYMSLIKQLGAFGIGIDSFFEAIENVFQEKVVADINILISSIDANANVN